MNAATSEIMRVGLMRVIGMGLRLLPGSEVLPGCHSCCLSSHCSVLSMFHKCSTNSLLVNVSRDSHLPKCCKLPTAVQSSNTKTVKTRPEASLCHGSLVLSKKSCFGLAFAIYIASVTSVLLCRPGLGLNGISSHSLGAVV